MALSAMAAACDPSADPCAGSETLRLNVTGTCSEGAQSFDLVREACGLTLTNLTGRIDLPRTGALNQDADPLREGGWQLYGPICAPTTTCPTYRCSTTRTAWQLNVECLSPDGETACTAVLTE